MLLRRARRSRLFPLPVDGILLAITLAMMALLKLFPQAGAVQDDPTTETAAFLLMEPAPGLGGADVGPEVTSIRPSLHPHSGSVVTSYQFLDQPYSGSVVTSYQFW